MLFRLGAGSASYAYYYCLEANQLSFSSNLHYYYICKRVIAFYTHKTSSHNKKKRNKRRSCFIQQLSEQQLPKHYRDLISVVESSSLPGTQRAKNGIFIDSLKKKEDLSEKQVM